MSSRSLKVVARRNNKTVATVTLAKGSEPVLVGRSQECVLRLPSEDTAVSSTHAKIGWKGSSLVIEDAGSRNGIYKDGAPIRRAEKMTPGVMFAIGSCIVSVEVPVQKKPVKAAHAYHRLEFLNGDNVGKMVDIVPRDDGKEFDFGLDPKCSVHLGDLLVSRRHAVLKVNAAGECWIEDLGSRNGTFVNGERLGGKERLLRDGDVISIAFFEFRFLDRNVSHTRVQLWFKLGVVAITCCVMAMGYLAWTASRQAVSTYLAAARRAAAAGEFEKAKESVAAARTARDATDFRPQIDALDNQIDAWVKTQNAWAQVRQDIADGRFERARGRLDGLVSGPVESWGWDPDAMADTKREADLASRALHLYFDGEDIIEAAGNDARVDSESKLRALIGPIEAFLRENGEPVDSRTYLAGLMKKLDALSRDLTVIRSGYDMIDESIGKISATTPDFRLIYEDFDRIAGGEGQSPAVRSYARRQLSICHAFVEAQDFIDDELAKLLKLDFAGVRALADNIRLPSQEMCIRHVRYSDARTAFVNRHRQLQQEAAAIQLMIEGLAAAGVTESGSGGDIGLFLNRTNVVKALKFDCLNRRPPSARRPEPVGDYDTLFGIEYTYEALQALPNSFNGRNIRSMGFSPRCVAARQAFDRVEAFVQYLDDDSRKDFQRGRLGRYYTRCVKIMVDREKLVQWLKTRKGSDRIEIVSGFYADYFAQNPAEVSKRMLKERFTKLRREMLTLGERYTLETDPEKQLAIRDEIMSKGIPGDPVLHTKWAQRFD